MDGLASAEAGSTVVGSSPKSSGTIEPAATLSKRAQARSYFLVREALTSRLRRERRLNAA